VAPPTLGVRHRLKERAERVSLLEHLRSGAKPTPPDTTRTPLPAVAAPSPLPVDAPAAIGPTPSAPGEAPRPRPIVRNEQYLDLKVRVHEELIHDLDPSMLTDDISFSSPTRRAVEQAAEERIGELDGILGRQDRLRLASEIADEVLGFGPLEPLLRDPTITEIMVNSWDRVYFERSGMIQRADTTFRDDGHVLNIIDKILRPRAVGSTTLRRWWMRACPMARASTR